MSSQVSSFNPAGHLKVPYNRVCLASQRIIETASYSTTPSFTPPAKEHHPFSAQDHHCTGPTIAAVVLAIQALKHYQEKQETEVKAVARPTDVPVGNYQKACADQVARRQQVGGASEVRDTGLSHSQTELSSDRDLCPWSYQDWKRKMHLSLISED